MTADQLRSILRDALKTALRERDRVTTQALRSAIAAIDNAEAVPTAARAGAIEAAPTGVGATEARRRDLSAAELHAILRHEVDERYAAARVCVTASPETAARLRAEADVIAPYTSLVLS
ncbi:hypothetical protein [Flexivirga caeni]|uniref:Glutamyl-tRNA amidotransferase n=1 Tax=Flexivirga caeni TaxID=2294115 RepID=A0A3M9M8V0_9MICO|nr:hypothetical protein [Flexivirga caeni]RNI21303.1 hypothetical protein EFY87_11455 [Flexivirga caeni]